MSEARRSAAEDRRWQRLAEEHQAALTAFLAAARALPDPVWCAPLAADKWSPAQAAEHLRLTYVTVARELGGGTGFRVRVGFFKRLILRLTVVPKLLRSGSFPAGAPATREVRPGPGPFPREETLAALAAAANAFVAALGEGGRGITHPFFGRLSVAQGFAIAAIHTRHHLAQLPACEARSSGAASGAPRDDPGSRAVAAGALP